MAEGFRASTPPARIIERARSQAGCALEPNETPSGAHGTLGALRFFDLAILKDLRLGTAP